MKSALNLTNLAWTQMANIAIGREILNGLVIVGQGGDKDWLESE